MRIAAFDLSLTESGVATWIDGRLTVGTLKPGTRRGMDRLAWIRRQVLLQSKDADLVVLESYSYGAKGSAFLSLAELGGVIRLALWETLPTGYRDIPPATLKKFATGKGNAKKEDVLAAAIRRLGYAGSNHNEADARWLLEIGLRLAGLQGTAAIPQLQLDALKELRAKLSAAVPA